MEESTSEIIREVSLIEIIGDIPILIALLAIALGVSSVIIRKRCWIQASLIFEFAIASLGIGITCWRLYSANSIYFDAYPDVSMWLSDFSVVWTAAAATLFGVSIGLTLIGFSWLLQKSG